MSPWRRSTFSRKKTSEHRDPYCSLPHVDVDVDVDVDADVDADAVADAADAVADAAGVDAADAADADGVYHGVVAAPGAEWTRIIMAGLTSFYPV